MIKKHTNKITISENKRIKRLTSKEYNFYFNKESGFFARWGKTKDDDPNLEFVMPEIADIEISTICTGINNSPCKFCYKSNTKVGKNMSLETFKIVFSKLPKSICQIALGIGDINANPELFEIMQHCRDNGVIPNITINGWNLTDEYAENLVKYCGAVSVSFYNKDVCYNAIEKLTNLGLKQVNIHYMLCEETYENAFSVIDDTLRDSRLKNLGSIVFLSLKTKGRANSKYTQLSQEKFKTLVNYALNNEVSFGFDSCSCSKFINSIKDHKFFKLMEQMSESCESSIFSTYINVEGNFFPCSFTEDKGLWTQGLSVLECSNFMNDIMHNERTTEWRQRLIENDRECFEYQI